MTTRINFTKKNIDDLAPPPGQARVDVYDTTQRNLFLLVAKGGSKTFYVRKKTNGKSERIQIGRYPEMSIEQARNRALSLLCTGARKSNVLAMRWVDIDLNLGLWRIPDTKNGESHTIPLTDPALEILRRRLQTRDGEWVLPGKLAGTHLVEPKRGWTRLLKAAGITDLRMHDLRRTLGSYMAISNQSLSIIGKALGHKSSASTEIYARLHHDPVRAAMQQAQSLMINAARQAQ